MGGSRCGHSVAGQLLVEEHIRCHQNYQSARKETAIVTSTYTVILHAYTLMLLKTGTKDSVC